MTWRRSFGQAMDCFLSASRETTSSVAFSSVWRMGARSCSATQYKNVLSASRSCQLNNVSPERRRREPVQ